ncbi:MAG TPA: hypothetical protein VG900_04065 [Hyphomicrobiaceae bacterium]|jgi:hypothetical protein|nr:hypothetical protein [Hyphomicrobiaceae bacterium]
MIRSLWAMAFACLLLGFAASGATAAPAPKAGAATLATGELVTKVDRRRHHIRRYHHRRYHHHRRHRVCWHGRHSRRHCVWRWYR